MQLRTEAELVFIGSAYFLQNKNSAVSLKGISVICNI